MPTYEVFREVTVVQSCIVDAADPEDAARVAREDDEWELTGDIVDKMPPSQVTNLHTSEDTFL